MLLGVVGPSGRVAFLPSGPRVDSDMIDRLAEFGPVTESYRFAGPCVTSGCIYWAQERCHVPDVVRHERERSGTAPLGASGGDPGGDPREHTVELPACAIRPSCRWWLQDGPSACALCPVVVTRTARTGPALEGPTPS